MVIDFTEEELKVLRQGLLELPIKVGIETLYSFDKKIMNAASQINKTTMAKVQEDK